MTLRLWVDASVARKPRALFELTKLAKDGGVEVAVHPHVHLELCRHLRSTYGARYSPSHIASYLEQQRVVIPPTNIDQSIAERWAERINERYPSTEAWEEAKRSTLGGLLRTDFVHEPGRLPMTTDWWVAMQVEDGEEDRVAVDDQGGEWQALRDSGRALTADAAREWLESASMRRGPGTA